MQNIKTWLSNHNGQQLLDDHTRKTAVWKWRVIKLAATLRAVPDGNANAAEYHGYADELLDMINDNLPRNEVLGRVDELRFDINNFRNLRRRPADGDGNGNAGVNGNDDNKNDDDNKDDIKEEKEEKLDLAAIQKLIDDKVAAETKKLEDEMRHLRNTNAQMQRRLQRRHGNAVSFFNFIFIFSFLFFFIFGVCFLVC